MTLSVWNFSTSTRLINGLVYNLSIRTDIPSCDPAHLWLYFNNLHVQLGSKLVGIYKKNNIIFLVCLNGPYKLVFHETNKTKHVLCFCLCFRWLRNWLMVQECLTEEKKQVQLEKTKLYRTIIYEIILTFLIYLVIF